MKHFFLFLVAFPSSAFALSPQYICSINLYKHEGNRDRDLGQKKFTYILGDPKKSSRATLRGFTAVIENNAKNSSCNNGICADASAGINLLIQKDGYSAQTFVDISQKISSVSLTHGTTLTSINCVKSD